MERNEWENIKGVAVLLLMQIPLLIKESTTA